MKTHIENLSLLPVLLAGLGLMIAGSAAAATPTTLHSFPQTVFSGPPYDSFTNSDGAGLGGLILSGNTLYGTADSGGISGNGTVFSVSTDGTSFAVLHAFTLRDIATGTNSDGAGPVGLVLSGNTLYGTAQVGGIADRGTVFSLNIDGSGFTNLYSFTNSDPVLPGSLILSGNTLYGTTFLGGSSGNGTVFALNKDGTGFTNLHSFTGIDGTGLIADLILSGNTLYGTAFLGGGSNVGTVFSVNIDGTGFTNLHSFTGSDGAEPRTRLALSGTTLYGTASRGGSFDTGTLFAVNTNGTDFRMLHDFSIGDNGQSPTSLLILSDNNLFGVAGGRLFEIKTDGTGFTFSYYVGDGQWLLSGTTFYGATVGGSGAVLSFTPPAPVQLTVITSRTSLILTWPTNATGYTLHSTTNLSSPAWTTNSSAPVVVNGQYTVTNPISGTQQFFRLSQ